MSVKINNIAKNTSYLTAALVLQKIISFTYFTLLARNLGPENLGKYYFAISFTTVFAIFIDLGLINVLMREVAKRKDRAQLLIGSVVAIKIPLALATVGVALLTIHLMGYPPITTHLVYLASICMVLDSFTTTFFAVVRGFHNLIYESISAVAFQVIVLILGLTAVYNGMNLLWIMSALVTASVFNFTYSSAVLWKKLGIVIKPIFDKVLIRSLIRLTVPFGLYALFQRFYMHFDSVLLSILAGDKQVGYYQIAFKIVFALQFLPLAFVASLYPAMSHYWINNREQLSISFERAISYLMIISIPISAGIAVLADKIILLFKSGYGEAILPMQIIILALFFIFINFPIGSLLNACDRQKYNTLNMGIVVATSLILNLILIPKFQAVGASITVLATNFLMTVLGFYWVERTIVYNRKKIFLIFLKSVTVAAAMGVMLMWLKNYWNIFILIPLGGIFYFFFLFLAGGYTKEDIVSVYNSFIKKIDKVKGKIKEQKPESTDGKQKKDQHGTR